VEHALSAFSSDNLSCMIVRLNPTGKPEEIPAGAQPNTMGSTDSAPAAESGVALAGTYGTGKTEDRKPTAAPAPTKEHAKNVAEKVAKG
jgi:hypothetical protein